MCRSEADLIIRLQWFIVYQRPVPSLNIPLVIKILSQILSINPSMDKCVYAKLL